MPTIDELPKGPLSPGNSLTRWNDMVGAINDLRRRVAALSGPNGGGNGSPLPICDIFLGYTTTTPPKVSKDNAPALTDARYYVVRCVAPDPQGDNTFGPRGFLSDNLSIDDDPFNGKIPMPPFVVATNLAELTGHVTDTSGSPGTHQLHDNTIVLVIGFPTRQNPVKRVYVFLSPLPRGIFPVNVSVHAGGTNGTPTTTANYTYDVTDTFTGVAISGGPYSPTWARANGEVNTATHGTGYYNSSGAFVLYQVDETPMDDTCS